LTFVWDEARVFLNTNLRGTQLQWHDETQKFFPLRQALSDIDMLRSVKAGVREI